MNSFGNIFRTQIFGESHGDFIGITIDGMPAGIPIKTADFTPSLQRRMPGAKGTTSRIETDIPQIISGVFNEFSTGAPITLLFQNNNRISSDYNTFKDIPRPGHADFVLSEKTNGFNDFRGGGHSSGRLTLAIVAAGVLAQKIIPFMDINARLIAVGGFENIEIGLQNAIELNDSVGGMIECTVKGIPIGLGEPFFNSIESVLAHAIFSIPAIKGIEFGSGFSSAKMKGSEHNDSLIGANGKTNSNHNGGINGGISNGNDLVFKVAVKPASSTPQEQDSWNFKTEKMEKFKINGRHDLCIALRVPVILESITAMVLADFYLLNLKSI